MSNSFQNQKDGAAVVSPNSLNINSLPTTTSDEIKEASKISVDEQDLKTKTSESKTDNSVSTSEPIIEIEPKKSIFSTLANLFKRKKKSNSDIVYDIVTADSTENTANEQKDLVTTAVLSSVDKKSITIDKKDKTVEAKVENDEQKTASKHVDDLKEVSIETHLKYFKNILKSVLDKRTAYRQWQEYYSRLNSMDKQALWQYANDRLPEITAHNTRLIAHKWRQIFSKKENLVDLAKDNVLYSQKGYGIIYCYLVAGKIRYIGQAKESSLLDRLNKMQSSNKPGYNNFIKRNLINAYREGALGIQTKLVKIDSLDQYEESLIKHYAPTNKLWNKKHNSFFNPQNYLA